MMEGMKENKKRFFRKGGQSHRIQRSFDNHTGSNSCCRAPAPSPSIDSMSLASGNVTPSGQAGVPLQSLPISLHQLQQHQLQQLHQQQILQKHAMGTSRITSSPCLPSPGSNVSTSTNGHGTSGGCNVSVTNSSGNCVPSSGVLSNNGAGGGPKTSGASNGLSGGPPKVAALAATRGIQGGVVGHSPNSASLDEAEINMNYHRRFMPAPRRARSAERFDGMRVAYTSSPGSAGDNPIRQATDDGLSRSYRSPQILRTVENNVLTTGGNGSNGVPGNNVCFPNVRRGTAASSSSNSGTKGPIEGPGFPVPSPPPSYTTAVSEAREPPPYHQVVAAMKQPNTLRTHGLKSQQQQQQQQQQQSLNNRYAGINSHNRTSHSLTSTPTGPSGIRSVASTPIFPNVDSVCGCHKCVMAERMNDPTGNGGEYNDAVYMESQAFLMHEIMTDGMAFCSIM